MDLVNPFQELHLCLKTLAQSDLPKTLPLISTLTLGHIRVACISQQGESTNIYFFIGRFGILCSLTKRCAMKECEAPESNKTDAGLEFIRHMSNSS